MNYRKMQTKKEFRRFALKQRSLIENRTERSRTIARNFTECSLYQKTNRIFTYLSYRSEVETAAVVSKVLSDRKLLAVPRVCGDHLIFYLISSMDCCRKGAYGILEPSEGCPVAEPKGEDIILVPGCAFTRDGKRLGYGGGYYDRYLAAFPQAVSVGLSFEEQLFEDIPWESLDRKLCYVITEKGIYHP